MRALVLAAALTAAAVSMGFADRERSASEVVQASAGGYAARPGGQSRSSGIAAHADTGRFLAQDRSHSVVRNGASTWWPVRVSEAHALQAIATGGMTIDVPGGQPVRLQFERHIEHENGNWTWIGRPDGGGAGSEAVLTFGEKAVFGLIRQGSVDLELTTEGGTTWLVQTDTTKLRTGSTVATSDQDFLPAPHELGGSLAGMRKQAGAAQKSAAAQKMVSAEKVADAPVASAAPAWTPTTIDIAIGYTSGFATRLGGQSQAVTRLTFLVDIANQAYLASEIDAQIRVVRTLQVNYGDATSNYSTLLGLTGVQCTQQTSGTRYLPDRRLSCNTVARPAALEPLAAARETYGADLAVLVRKFEDPENGSCGIAWMLGGGQNSIAGNDAFGMAVVSDSSGALFPDNNNTCREDTLAHELGHTMGQQHDVVTARGTDDSNGDLDPLDPEEYGRHPYSFGYSTDGLPSNIYTIMSVRRPGQTGYRVFSNPRIMSCGNAPCGIADVADNARSLAITMPSVAGFRSTVADFWDVSGDFWAFDFIRRLADAGITGGCAVDPPMYCPASVVTRDQMAVFLLRGMHGSAYDPPTVATSSFADVPANFWAISWIEQLAQEGITTGCATNPLRYCPAAAVNREQMAVFLLRAKYGSSYTPPPATGVFADVPASYWAAPWIEKLAADGVTGGCSTTPKAYCPRNSVTRDQMAVFLVRTFGL
jgi:hypothetical protein